MRIHAIVLFAILTWAGTSLGQPGSIIPFSDPTGTDCNVIDTGPCTVSVYVLHMNSGGATASHVLTISYAGSGLSEVCSRIQEVPDPTASPQEILITDCGDPPSILAGMGGVAYINGDETCGCDIPEGADQGAFQEIASVNILRVFETFCLFHHLRLPLQLHAGGVWPGEKGEVSES